MGSSAVLKDASGRPAGYVIADEKEIVCRARVDMPVEIMLLFADGTAAQYPLDGSTEKKFCAEGRKMTGCCVVNAGRVLLYSDDAARRTADECLQQKRREAKSQNRPVKTERAELRAASQEQQRNAAPVPQDAAFPRRRWPPPPCWETANYQNGIWQEEQ